MGALTLLAWVALAGPCHAVDGDTLRCGGERIRLLGIDAPELPGHCRVGRRCVEGDPYAATATLAAAMRGPLRIERLGQDAYGRTLANVEAGGRSLACVLLAAGRAAYRPGYDRGGMVGRRCGVTG